MGAGLPAIRRIPGGLAGGRPGRGAAGLCRRRAGGGPSRLARYWRGQAVPVNATAQALAHRDLLAEVPGRVRGELGLRAARVLRGGGTSARVLLCEDGDGGHVVVKVLRAGAGSVDGHDLGSFLRKPQQIARVHRDLPGLSPYYVPLTGSWHGPGWGAYATPWIDGGPP